MRVLFAHRAEQAVAGGAELVSEARVDPHGGGAGLQLRALWAAVGPFERPAGAEALSAAVKRAESRAPDPPAANSR